MNDYARGALEALAYVESLMTQLDRSNPAGYIASAPALARIDPVLPPIRQRDPRSFTERTRGRDPIGSALPLISPSSFLRFSRPFPGDATELFKDMATHKCEELKGRGAGLMEWLFPHPQK
jgi:hypothetical protein